MSQTDYKDSSPGGPIVDSINNTGVITETRSDLMGRTLRTIQNFDGHAYGATGSGFDSDGNVLETDTAEDVTTDYQYDYYGRLATMTVYDATGSAVTAEATKYLYSSTISPEQQTGQVAPDSTDTLSQSSDGVWTIDSGTDHTTTAYDLQGELLTSTDERGVTHTYVYDDAGRETLDNVTNFGTITPAGQTIDAIQTVYDDIGRVYQTASYGMVDGDNAILNQIQYAYDGWGNEIDEWQALSGAVDTSTTPAVQYEYDDGAVDGVAQYVRLTDMIYPNGRDVSYGYGDSGSVDEVMSRLATISDSSGTLAAYSYLGTGTVASENLEQPQISLDYSADNFAALDRFGNILDQVWSSYGAASGTAGTLDGYSYTYDGDNNRTSKVNATDAALSETYNYNALDELTSMARGTISDGAISDPSYTQSWTLDSLGNFLTFDDNGSSQDQTTDASNEIQSISGGTATPAYDLAGNMTTTPDPSDESTGLTCVYDAWDRLVQVSNGSTVVAQYEYDSTGRRVAELSDFTTIGETSYPQAVTYYYFAGQNAIETRFGTFTAGDAVPAPESLPVQYQYVFSAMSPKTPLVRDTYVDGSISANDRIYYLADANTNVTAVVGYDTDSSTWAVVERYVYNPYGTVTVYSPDWSTVVGTSLSASTVGNTIGFASMSFDSVTGLYNDEARWYSTADSTFISRDPAKSDVNLYRYCGNSAIDATDNNGLEFKSLGKMEVRMAPDNGDDPDLRKSTIDPLWESEDHISWYAPMKNGVVTHTSSTHVRLFQLVKTTFIGSTVGSQNLYWKYQSTDWHDDTPSLLRLGSLTDWNFYQGVPLEPNPKDSEAGFNSGYARIIDNAGMNKRATGLATMTQEFEDAAVCVDHYWQTPPEDLKVLGFIRWKTSFFYDSDTGATEDWYDVQDNAGTTLEHKTITANDISDPAKSTIDWKGPGFAPPQEFLEWYRSHKVPLEE